MGSTKKDRRSVIDLLCRLGFGACVIFCVIGAYRGSSWAPIGLVIVLVLWAATRVVNEAVEATGELVSRFWPSDDQGPPSDPPGAPAGPTAPPAGA